ncbi:translation initiation factor IF-2-like [Perognathus longimembris pacificus]|uniref:translation initiation factor IF-2-like n=1 Tax=Perognathus longimembris pacificus TaxID=214514 RepID=UPI00201845F6|nr:translation initiation factor IF-2-like [Perognathus longimembris pacificus]
MSGRFREPRGPDEGRPPRAGGSVEVRAWAQRVPPSPLCHRTPVLCPGPPSSEPRSPPLGIPGLLAQPLSPTPRPGADFGGGSWPPLLVVRGGLGDLRRLPGLLASGSGWIGAQRSPPSAEGAGSPRAVPSHRRPLGSPRSSGGTEARGSRDLRIGDPRRALRGPRRFSPGSSQVEYGGIRPFQGPLSGGEKSVPRSQPLPSPAGASRQGCKRRPLSW